MFSVPLPDGERIVNAGDSYVHIYLPDDATDVHRFFLAIFDASYFEPPPSEQPTSVVLSILRLAHKYDVIFPKHRAVAHLNVLFPTKWDAIWKVMTANKHRESDILPLLELAPAIEIPWVLPAVHVILAATAIKSVLRLASWDSLDSSIQQRFLIDRELCVSLLSASSSWIWSCPTSPHCVSVARCTDIVTTTYACHGGIWKMISIPSPIAACDECIENIQMKCYGTGEVVWKNMPTIIALESWDDLISAKSSFI